jgi:hypothetical protein
MPEHRHTLIFTRRLKELGIRYMVSGSVASSLYGTPRLTMDVDLVAVLFRSHIVKLTEAFPHPEFYCPPAEVIAVEVAREQRGQFNVIHLPTNFKADFYLAGRDPLNVWGLTHTRTAEIAGEPVVFAPPEFVIVRKLEFYREGGSEKHINDIRAMLELTPSLVESPELNEFIAERGLQSCWNKVLESIP